MQSIEAEKLYYHQSDATFRAKHEKWQAMSTSSTTVVAITWVSLYAPNNHNNNNNNNTKSFT